MGSRPPSQHVTFRPGTRIDRLLRQTSKSLFQRVREQPLGEEDSGLWDLAPNSNLLKNGASSIEK